MGVSGSLYGGWAAGSMSAEPQPWYKWADVEPLSQARKGKEEMHPCMQVGEGRGLQGPEGGCVLVNSGHHNKYHRPG